jgi:hypothetical protein
MNEKKAVPGQLAIYNSNANSTYKNTVINEIIRYSINFASAIMVLIF